MLTKIRIKSIIYSNEYIRILLYSYIHSYETKDVDLVDKLIGLFKALSDETRVRILILLYKQKLCVCQIYGIMGESQPKISKHLAKLKNMGLIKDERQEQFIYYYLNKDNNILEDLLNKIVLNLENYPIIKKDLGRLENANEYIITKE